MTDTTKPEALRLAEQLETFHPNTLQNKCAAELRRLHGEVEALRAKVQSYMEIGDATAKDADKAYALLRWAETEMRYAAWHVRLSDNQGRADLYEAVVEFLK
jgi:hypothetical protein